MKLQKCLIFFVISIFWLSSCQTESQKYVPDVSHIEVTPDIRRFEQALFRLDTLHLTASLQALQKEYPIFSNIYFNSIMGANDPRYAPSGFNEYVKGFVAHQPVRNLFDTINIVYNDFSEIEAQFTEAFKYFRYYFPEEPLPSITTFMSEYSFAAFIYGNNDLAVGLDFFLGSDYPYRQYNAGNPNFSEYLTRTFNKDHLVLKTMRPLVQELLGAQEGKRLLDYMIYNGKEMYILEKLLPTTPDTVLTEYSPEKLAWVRDNELPSWAFLLQEDLLYSTNFKSFQKLIQPSPVGLSNMPPDAPGRVANWLGYRIVEAYMARQPNLTLQDLMSEKDAQTILDKSKYKPQRQ